MVKPIPDRDSPAKYGFYAYDFVNSITFDRGPPQPKRLGLSFFSLVKDLEGLKAVADLNKVPDVKLVTCGGTSVIEEGMGRVGVKALCFGGKYTNDPGVMITGGIHAREWIAPVMAYLVAEYLIKNYRVRPTNKYQTAIKDLVDARQIIVAPMLNPSGNLYSVFGQLDDARMWRKNRRLLPSSATNWRKALVDRDDTPNSPFKDVTVAANVASYKYPRYKAIILPWYLTQSLPNSATRGVDLCRNYDTTYYGYSDGEDPPGSEDGNPNSIAYFGPRRESERETKVIHEYLSENNINYINTAIDYHSYSKYVLYPTEAFAGGLCNGSYASLGRILQCLINPQMVMPADAPYDYKLGSPIDLVGYNALGTPADFLNQQMNTRSFVVELDPVSTTGYPSGFELPEDKIMEVFEKNIRGALALIMAAGSDSSAKDSWWYKTRSIMSAEREFLTWDVFGRGNNLPM